MVAGFRCWQHHSQVSRTSHAACTSAVAKWSSALAFWEVNVSRRFMQRWHGHAPARLASATQLRAQTVLQAYFLQWESAVREQKRHGLSAVAYRNTTHMRHSFRLWWEASRKAKMVALAVLHLQRRTLQCCYDALRAAATTARQSDAIAAGYSARSIKKRGWQLLRTGVAKAARLGEAGAALHRLSTEQCATDMLMLWCAATHTALQLRARMEYAVTRWRSRLLAAALAGWRSRVQSIARKNRNVQVCNTLLVLAVGALPVGLQGRACTLRIL